METVGGMAFCQIKSYLASAFVKVISLSAIARQWILFSKSLAFNGWTQGEIFIVTDKLIPNARRDDFEQNDAYYKLIEKLKSGVGLEITRTIREASLTRNNPNAKALREVEKKNC